QETKKEIEDKVQPARAEQRAPSPAESRAIVSTGPERAEVTQRTMEAAEDGDADKTPAPAAPSTRRLARQLGVDLHRVEGTGPGGRITSDDVQSFVRTSLTKTKPVDVRSPMAAPELPDFNKFGVVERQAMSKLARTAAANLSLS